MVAFIDLFIVVKQFNLQENADVCREHMPQIIHYVIHRG